MRLPKAPRSRAYYRVHAVRNITASAKGKTKSATTDKMDELAKIRGQVDELIDTENGENTMQACADTRNSGVMNSSLIFEHICKHQCTIC